MSLILTALPKHTQSIHFKSSKLLASAHVSCIDKRPKKKNEPTKDGDVPNSLIRSSFLDKERCAPILLFSVILRVYTIKLVVHMLYILQILDDLVKKGATHDRGHE